MRNFIHRWLQSGYFFSKLGNFFPIFEKGAGETSPPLPPLVTRLDWMLVLQKRTGWVNVWLVLNGCWPSKKDIHRKNRILCWLSWFSKDLFANLLISAKNFVVPPCNDYYYYYYYLLLTTYYLLLTTYYHYYYYYYYRTGNVTKYLIIVLENGTSIFL